MPHKKVVKVDFSQKPDRKNVNTLVSSVTKLPILLPDNAIEQYKDMLNQQMATVAAAETLYLMAKRQLEDLKKFDPQMP